LSKALHEKARALLKAERGAVVKPRGGRTAVLLAYPNTYYVGMSNLGFQTVYALINDRQDALAERVFLPDDADREEFIRTGTPLFAIESQSPARVFDILAFSVSFENDYINVAEMFRLSGIPPLSDDRDGSHPLVILGGICTFFNPEPISGFFDAVIVGEAEETLPLFLDAYETLKRDLDRPALLRKLAAIPGVYVPSLYRPEYNGDGTLKSSGCLPGAPPKVTRMHVADLDAHPTHSVILTPETEFNDMYMVELSRGCGRHCRFCMAGYLYRPPRVRSLASVVSDINSGKKLTDKIGLVGSAVSDYPDIEGLASLFMEEGLNFSASSMRADSLTKEAVRLLAKGNRTVAIAPEAGSERLRAVINKNITEEQILNAVEMLIAGGILNVKLYFMVGLPAETVEDVEAIVVLAKKAAQTQLDAARKIGRMGRLTLSVNCFIPKPWTPFQWEAMEDPKSLKGKLGYIKDALKGAPNMNVIHDVPKWAYLQGALARGDRRLGPVIIAASESGGDWKGAFRKENLSMDFYAGRVRESDEIFPWDFIDTGIERDYLRQESERAIEGKHTPPCKVGKCKLCGVCD
jgi:radical SAM family uncharacterized protein